MDGRICGERMNKGNKRPRMPLPLCPSCGMDSGKRMEDDKCRYYVVCDSCGLIVGPYMSKSAATKAWRIWKK